MSTPIITVENLSKRYAIRHENGADRGLRHAIQHVATAPLRWLRERTARSLELGARRNELEGGDSKLRGGNREPLAAPYSLLQASRCEEFWALKDVCFEVKQGEVVGIIGRNGAGKSTLLKILSRITEPTAGLVRMRGRVASLLEVGTGFHPELSGRENIFVNGAVLGMSRAEIKRKFDEIVAFAEVEKFIDTPVKRYSSGMYVRLAFAVAAHLEPEILIVDEVLAVGDAAFQKKCLGKLGDVAKGGRTVVFVSHQMNQVRRLCEKCIWLNQGRVQKSGATIEVISAYEAALTATSFSENRSSRVDVVPARFIKWEIVEPRHEPANFLAAMGPVTLRFVLKVNKAIRNGLHGISLFNDDNQLMWATAVNHLNLEIGVHDLVYALPGLPLRPGNYRWDVSIHDENGLVDLCCCVPEMIIATEPVTHPLDMYQGVLNLPWTLEVR